MKIILFATNSTINSINIHFKDSCKHGKNDLFVVTFRNSDEYSVDIKRYDENWNEELVRSRLKPEQESTHETDFRSKWLFKRSDTAHRLKAQANGVTSDVFTGCHFTAKPGRFLPVTILAGKTHFSTAKNLLNNEYITSYILVNMIIFPIPDKQTKGSTTLTTVTHTAASLVLSSRQLSTQAETTIEPPGNSNNVYIFQNKRNIILIR